MVLLRFIKPNAVCGCYGAVQSVSSQGGAAFPSASVDFSGSGALKKAEVQRGVMVHLDILALEENVCGLLWQVRCNCSDSSDGTACLPEENVVTSYPLLSAQPSSEILLSSSCQTAK